MTRAVSSDYDADPGRFRAHDRSWQLRGDTHEMVADRLARERSSPVVDVGGGQGRLAELLPGTVVVDLSPTRHRPSSAPMRWRCRSLPERRTQSRWSGCWIISKIRSPP